MIPQFITNSEGEKTAVFISINDYQDLLHKSHLHLELTNNYKKMIDRMLEQENEAGIEHIPYKRIKERFRRTPS